MHKYLQKAEEKVSSMLAQRWPIEEMSLDQLALDLHNVRIPGGEADESAIANYLVEAEDLLGLIRDILRDGYLDNELPVVAGENGRHVVLEGNRRVTALKAIAAPSLLGKSAARVDRLKSRYPHDETPTLIRVMVAPSREAAQPLLARLHTRNPKRSWIREQQAIFYHAQLSPTVTVDDLRMTYPGEAASIPSFIRMGEMRELIRAMRYDDPDLEEFVKTSKLKMTSLEYAYEPRKIQKVLSLEFTKDGLLASKQLTEGQRRGLMYLLQRFKEGSLNTRSPELKARGDEHEPFVEELGRIVAGQEATAGAVASAGPDQEPGTGTADTDGKETSGVEGDKGSDRNGGQAVQAGAGAGNQTSGSGKASKGSRSGQAADASGGVEAGSRGPNRGDTRSRLDMEGFEYKGSSGGMRRRFEELRRIDVRDFPNAAHDLLRTVLECSIKEYLSAQGNPLPPRSTIGHCVEQLARAYVGNAKITSLLNAINRKGRMSAQQYAGTTESLNSSNHEPDQFAQGSDVHEAWDRIKPILIEIVGK